LYSSNYNIPGNVEEQGLEEKSEADPLIVLVISESLVRQISWRRDSWVRHVVSQDLSRHGWHGESRVDPAVGVHDIVGDLLHDAVDRVANVLMQRNSQNLSTSQTTTMITLDSECHNN
jgi:hypothetical protein